MCDMAISCLSDYPIPTHATPGKQWSQLRWSGLEMQGFQKFKKAMKGGLMSSVCDENQCILLQIA